MRAMSKCMSDDLQFCILSLMNGIDFQTLNKFIKLLSYCMMNMYQSTMYIYMNKATTNIYMVFKNNA